VDDAQELPTRPANLAAWPGGFKGARVAARRRYPPCTPASEPAEKEVDMRASAVFTLVGVALLTTAVAVSAQQTPPVPPAASAPAAGSPAFLDCPPPAGGAAATPGSSAAPSGSAVGTPQGAGQGSGLTALPSTGSMRRVEGEIKTIDSTRTNRIVEVGDVKLEVEPSTVILVDCKTASTADLKEGARIKAAYEVKADNRNVATVIEAK
jgi:hypothetical protein